MVCQIAAVMEIVHPLVGFVKTSPMMPIMQVFHDKNLSKYMPYYLDN